MTKTRRFTLRLSPDDLKIVEKLAEKMQRSQSDAIRHAIYMAAKKGAGK